MKRSLRAAALPLLALLTACSAPPAQAGRLQPPPGYLAPLPLPRGKAFSCPAPPPPYTAVLDFPSKYEGSGRARDRVNADAEARYQRQIAPITQMEKGVNRLVARYLKTGEPAVLRCTLDWYASWSDAGALRGAAANHTGRSLRKWALGSLSGAWLHLRHSSSQPLAADPERVRRIEHWLGALAAQVVPEWPLDDPRERINNHYYWAAWSVMATGVALDRRDLFDWSLQMYQVFAGQVDAEGYLPNELARETRALAYHNYALNPLAMIAAFAGANGIALGGEGDAALARLAQRTLAGLRDPAVFERRSGHRQKLEDLEDRSSKLAWLEPYCWMQACDEATQQELAALRPLGSYRLGGDVSAVFALPR